VGCQRAPQSAIVPRLDPKLLTDSLDDSLDYSPARAYTPTIYELTHDLDAGLVVYSWLSRGRRVRLQWAMIFHSPSVHLGDVVGGIRAARARGAAPSVHRQKAR